MQDEVAQFRCASPCNIEARVPEQISSTFFPSMYPVCVASCFPLTIKLFFMHRGLVCQEICFYKLPSLLFKYYKFPFMLGISCLKLCKTIRIKSTRKYCEQSLFLQPVLPGDGFQKKQPGCMHASAARILTLSIIFALHTFLSPPPVPPSKEICVSIFMQFY